MANVNGTWLDREARDERIEILESRIRKLERLRKADALKPSQVQTLITDKREYIRLKRIHRSEHDVLYFGMEYFSEDGNPDNPDNLVPEGVNVNNAADFHQQLTGMLDDVTRGNVDRHIAWHVLEGTLRRLGCRISFLSIRLYLGINAISSYSQKLPIPRATLLRGGAIS